MKEKIYIILADEEWFAIGQEDVFNYVMEDLKVGFINRIEVQDVLLTSNPKLTLKFLYSILSDFHCEDSDYFMCSSNEIRNAFETIRSISHCNNNNYLKRSLNMTKEIDGVSVRKKVKYSK